MKMDYSILPMESIDDLPQQQPIQAEDFTCYDCHAADRCKYVWDIFNIQGLCLAESYLTYPDTE